MRGRASEASSRTGAVTSRRRMVPTEGNRSFNHLSHCVACVMLQPDNLLWLYSRATA